MGEPLTNEQMEQAATLVLAFLTFGAVAFGLLSALYFRFMEWRLDRQEARESVKNNPAPAPAIPSSAPADPAPSAPSSLQTDGAQTDRPPQPATIPAEKLLPVYTLMREHNISREKARAALKAAGLPLDNNVWSKAEGPKVEPTDETAPYRTPYAGRVTRREYYPDEPELEYQQPA